MKGASFSVCIPNFNHGRYIGETIESVLKQSYKDFEVVVVDNASTDDSVKVARSFGSEKVRVYENPYNVGFAPNLDRAASKARNDFIIVLSSDDLMLPDALETYVSVIRDWGERAKETLIGSAYEQIDGEGRVIGRSDLASHFTVGPAKPPPVTLACRDAQIFDGREVFGDVFPRMLVPAAFCSTAYSRTLYDSVGGYSSINVIGPDAHFAYKCLLRGAWVTFVDRPLFQYRIHGGGQLGRARGEAVLKVPLDRYLFTFIYTDAELASAGVARREIVDHLVNDSCLREGGLCVTRGERLEELRHLLFAAATYPRVAFSRPQFWGLAALLLSGPLGPWIARHLHEAGRKGRPTG
jgi:glycosyltransferase involved in cell wall biosynthesis